MNFKDYLEFTNSTAIYPEEVERSYLIGKLVTESTEVLDVYLKKLRGDFDDNIELYTQKVLLEISDCFWYLVRVCDMMKFEVPDLNTNIIETETLVDFMYNLVWETARLSRLVHTRNSETNKMKLVDDILICMMIITTSLCNMPTLLGSTVEEVLDLNVQKLSKRKKEGTLQGFGEDSESRKASLS